jgi:hypothetical protein
MEPSLSYYLQYFLQAAALIYRKYPLNPSPYTNLK